MSGGRPFAAETQQIKVMLNYSVAFVSARADGVLIGIARGVSDGVRGYLTGCKLDPAFQGPAATTRRDGRIEDDSQGIACQMAKRVLEKLIAAGSRRVDVLAWGTEVDFCEEIGPKKLWAGLVGLWD